MRKPVACHVCGHTVPVTRFGRVSAHLPSGKALRSQTARLCDGSYQFKQPGPDAVPATFAPIEVPGLNGKTYDLKAIDTDMEACRVLLGRVVETLAKEAARGGVLADRVNRAERALKMLGPTHPNTPRRVL